MITDKSYCMSSFLMYRRVVKQGYCFKDNLLPKTLPLTWEKAPINNSKELEIHLRNRVQTTCKKGKTALALSGGIDSAILAKFMPQGSTAYTFKCTAGNLKTTDETAIAAKYAEICGLKHKVIEITWEDMEQYSPILLKNKNAPFHSIEVQIYKAGLQAKKDGFDNIIYGETADVNYGGLSKILSKDWLVGDFIERYAYVKPWLVLKNPQIDFSPVENYEHNGYVDVHKYLSNFDILESINSYKNACDCANINFIAPFADTFLNVPLDYTRIRAGENKYLIREIFNRLYPNLNVPEKLPMPRATDQWLKDWTGPVRPEFYKNSTLNMNGDQKWLVYILEKYLNYIDNLK